MSDVREELKRAFVLDDEAKASFERHERQRAERSDGSALVYKTFGPRPKQQQSSPTMGVLTQAGWDHWVKSHIAIAIEDHRNQMIAVVGQAMYEYVHQRLADEVAKLREEIGSLRAELTLATGIQRGEVAALKKGNCDAA